MQFPIFHHLPPGTWHWKRRIDVGLILALLPLLLPLVLIICLWVRSVSKGSILFRQKRVGRNGKPFTMYKFRSMHDGASMARHLDHVRQLADTGAPMTKLDAIGDERLIPGGWLMRTVGLDELPQLLNVLQGEMSIVGPRPCLPEEFTYFSDEQKHRFKVLPGLTGLWQVGGKNATTFGEMSDLDNHYCGNASLWVDLAIIAKTPGAIIQQLRRQTLGRNANVKPRPSGDVSSARSPMGKS